MTTRDTIVALEAASAKMVSSGDDLSNVLHEVFESSSSTLDISYPIQPDSRSLSDILAGIAIIKDVVSAFGSSASLPLVPEAKLKEFGQGVAEVISRLDAVTSQVKSFASTGVIASFDQGTFTATFTNGSSASVRQQLLVLNDSFDLMLATFQFLSHSLKPRGMFSFQSAAFSLSAMINDMSKELDTLRKEIADVRKNKESVRSNSEKVSQNLAETELEREAATELVKEVQQKRDDATQISSLIKQSQAEIETAITGVRRLKAFAEEYEVQFEEFQGAMDARQSQIKSGEETLASLLSRLATTETMITETKEKSLQMLEGATVAGLASVYKTQQSDLNGKLKFASAGFYLSILLLFASAVPLIAYVAAPFLVLLNPEWADQIQAIRGAPIVSDWQYLGQVFSRLVILVPAAWLVRITSGRYNSLFKLREHYAHKYAIAASVEGFKRQAPGYEGDIAAATYAELIYNPVMETEPAKNEVKAPNRLLNIIVERLNKPDKTG